MTSIEQQLNLVVVAQPINAIKDADILERLWKGFEDQLWKAKTIASERLRLGGDSSVAPTFPMLETNASDNADETSRKCDLYDEVAHMQTLRKRGRKTASKVLFQVPFSFQPPEFCLKENINLDIYYIHSASQKTLRSHQEVIEFLLDVEIPRKGGSKKAKVVGAVDNQKTLRSHQEVIEFLLDVEIPLKGGSKKAKVVGAVDNQVQHPMNQVEGKNCHSLPK
ncbi:hypothetical protein JHK82_012062 [Glycine max]|nr:hypothetical protein JHK82_012062 [Glycine max]